ncbi:MAG: hypothetical protein L6243_06020 [Candidatus Altiarchaeales archaeon]|nr:hypothetical protein [Candidatus Altiarchaeota archaeon]MBU4266720.1 hypothetical protein [Candidatus Altiarchaeota archaeon]MCG2783129.1 hypothetical protein [Candidatus Altiarchaeales archaeon]
MYSLEVRGELDRKLLKLAKKNKKQLIIIRNKTEEILRNPHRYKNLRKPLQHWKRVHIDRHFVLTFSIDEETRTVTLEDYEHHEKIYSGG